MKAKATITSPVARHSSRQPVRRPELERFFAGIDSRMKEPEPNVAQLSPSVPLDLPELKRFFTATNHRVQQAETLQRRLDKRRATGFNVFDLIEPDENKLSDILADLLDPEGDHGQGDLFLRLLFKQIDFDLAANRTIHATVKREAPTHGIQKYRRRIDVLVEADVMLAIENKLDSLDQRDQVKDYLEYLRRHTHSSHKQAKLIYLTPNGRPPESLEQAALDEAKASGGFLCWSYQKELHEWLAECRKQCMAPKICHFLSDFSAYIVSGLRREPVTNDGKKSHDN